MHDQGGYLLAPRRVGKSHHAGVLHIRMPSQGGLDFVGVDVDAAGDDPIGTAAHDVQMAICVELSEVVRSEPTVFVDP